MSKKSVAIIGYSGHAYVIVSTLRKSGFEVAGYFDKSAKAKDPFNLSYMGSESDENAVQKLRHYDYFISIGDNAIRKNIQNQVSSVYQPPITIIDLTASIQDNVFIGKGVFIGPNSIINALSTVGDGVVCNSGSIIEHECSIGSFSFISPGAVLCGNVEIGENVFIGANAVIKQGVKIGDSAIIGAGTVVLSDIAKEKKVVGNPQRFV